MRSDAIDLPFGGGELDVRQCAFGHGSAICGSGAPDPRAQLRAAGVDQQIVQLVPLVVTSQVCRGVRSMHGGDHPGRGGEGVQPSAP